MTDFTKEINDRYPTREEVEEIMRRARDMRAKVLRDAFTGFARKLQEAVTPRRRGPRGAIRGAARGTLRHA